MSQVHGMEHDSCHEQLVDDICTNLRLLGVNTGETFMNANADHDKCALETKLIKSRTYAVPQSLASQDKQSLNIWTGTWNLSGETYFSFI